MDSCFKETCCVHLQGSETSVTTYKATRCYNPEHLFITPLLHADLRSVYTLLPYDKKDGQRARALREVRAVNSLGTQITPGVQHANKINDDAAAAVQCPATGLHASEKCGENEGARKVSTPV